MGKPELVDPFALPCAPDLLSPGLAPPRRLVPGPSPRGHPRKAQAQHRGLRAQHRRSRSWRWRLRLLLGRRSKNYMPSHTPPQDWPPGLEDERLRVDHLHPCDRPGAVAMMATMTFRPRRGIAELTYFWLILGEHPAPRARRLRHARAGQARTGSAPHDARPSCARERDVQRSRGWTALRRAGRALPAHAW